MLGTPDTYFEDIHPGFAFEGPTITISEAHLVAYAGLLGDFYEVHMNAVAASKSRFGERVAHGPFTFALTIGMLAQRIHHLNWHVEAIVGSTNLRFLAPVPIGATLTPRAEVAGVRERESNGAITLAMRAIEASGKDVFTGEFTLFVAKRPAGAA